jgi:hypothetical protein
MRERLQGQNIEEDIHYYQENWGVHIERMGR